MGIALIVIFPIFVIAGAIARYITKTASGIDEIKSEDDTQRAYRVSGAWYSIWLAITPAVLIEPKFLVSQNQLLVFFVILALMSFLLYSYAKAVENKYLRRFNIYILALICFGITWLSGWFFGPFRLNDGPPDISGLFAFFMLFVQLPAALVHNATLAKFNA